MGDLSNIGRRELKKVERRDNILTAAEKLFFANGYDNVSLNEIAKEADLGRSTVYLYFENKEELFFAIVLKGTKILHELIIEETDKVETSFSKLTAFRKAYYIFAKEYPEHLKAYNYLLSGRFNLAKIENREDRLDSIVDGKNNREFKKEIDEIRISNSPIAKFTTSEYLNEILFLRREMLNTLCKSIDLGKTEGIIRPDVNSVEATVLLTLIANSIDNLPPDLRDLLESQKINHEKFLVDVGDFIGYMVSNRNNK